MSENLHNIDDLFKKAIEQHQDAPSPAVWDGIDKNLDKKKVVSISRKYNKLKWAAAALLLFSFGLAMYTFQTRMKNKELVKQNSVNKENTNKEGVNNDEKKSTNNEINTPEVESALENKNSETVGTETGTDEEKGRHTNVLHNESKANNSIEQQVVKRMEKDSPEKQNDLNRDQQVNNSKESIENDAVKQNNKVESEPEKQETSIEKYVAKIPLAFYFDQSKVLSTIPSANPFKSNALLIQNNNLADNTNTKISSAKKNTSKTTKASRFSVTAFFSPEFISTKLQDDQPRFREDNRHEIKNTESTRTSSSYGVLINYSLGKNLSVQSGSSVFIRNTSFSPRTIYARPDNHGAVNYRVSCSAGSAFVSTKSGTTPTQGDSTKILSGNNTLQYLSIPLSINYSIGKGKLKIISGVGFSVNFLSKGEVETVITTAGGNETSITKDIQGLKPNYFNSKLNLGAAYQISKHIALNVAPTASFALSSINKNAAVKTKINSFGLSSGITIKL